jgi:hypothetical protein
MFQQGTGNTWHWSCDVNPGVNFCVWVLQADGLRIPPFDRHPDGDGSLRAVGLTAATWRSWLAGVLKCRRQLSASPFPPPPGLVESVVAPASVWGGDPAIGARLAELWPGYAAQADAWKRHYALEADPTRLTPAAHRRLWRDLAPYRGRLPPLSFFLVEYPQVVLDVLPPDAALIGTGGGRLDPSAYAAAVLRTAELLARET